MKKIETQTSGDFACAEEDEAETMKATFV